MRTSDFEEHILFRLLLTRRLRVREKERGTEYHGSRYGSWTTQSFALKKKKKRRAKSAKGVSRSHGQSFDFSHEVNPLRRIRAEEWISEIESIRK